MTGTRWFIGGILSLLAVAAQAHARLTDSDPRDGSSGKAPERIVLTFSESARLTALTLQRAGAEAHKLALPAAMAARIAIPLPALTPGTYILRWRAVGEDSHITSGELRFSVVESAAAGGDAAHRPGA